MHIILLIISVSLNATAQLMLKHGMNTIGAINSGTDFLQKIKLMITNYWLWFGLISYGLSFLIYMIVLSKIEVSRTAVVAFSSVTVIIFVFSAIFLNESFTVAKVIGLILCLAGCVLILVTK